MLKGLRTHQGHRSPQSHPVSQLFVLRHEKVVFLLQIRQLGVEGLRVVWLRTSSTQVKLDEAELAVKANVHSQRPHLETFHDNIPPIVMEF